jgi:hypothetical protein
MTMPHERTAALIAAGEFLQELRLSDDTPPLIRAQALAVLRHFPSAGSISHEAARQFHAPQHPLAGPWLLPVDAHNRPQKI